MKATKKGRGRPPIPASQRRSENMGFRGTRAERRRIERASRAVGTDLSEFVRRHTLDAADKYLED